MFVIFYNKTEVYMEEVSLECAKEVYEQYEVLVMCAGIPKCDCWSLKEFHDYLNDFMYKYDSVFNMMQGLGFDWNPSIMDSYLHYYGKEEEYYISLMVLIEDTRVKETDGLFSSASIHFSIDTNDDSLPAIGGLEEEYLDYEEGDYEEGEEDDEEDDKPWLR